MTIIVIHFISEEKMSVKKKKIKERDFESGSLDQWFSALDIHKLKNILMPEPHPRPKNQNLGTSA